MPFSEFGFSWVNDRSEECEVEMKVVVNDAFNKYVVVCNTREIDDVVVFDINTGFWLRLKEGDEDVLTSTDFYVLRDVLVVVFKKE